MIDVNVLATGSKRNAVILNDTVMIDCGVPYKDIVKYAAGLKLVLLTHCHIDHFYRATIRKLAREYPLLRFGCCEWLVEPLLSCGIDDGHIDVYSFGFALDYKALGIIQPFPLIHDMPNCGYAIRLYDVNERILYATDTASLDKIEAANFDLYLIEANYGEAEIAERVKTKEAAGEYCHEYRAAKNHLSYEQANDWLARNMGANSKVIYLHGHEGARLS